MGHFLFILLIKKNKSFKVVLLTYSLCFCSRSSNKSGNNKRAESRKHYFLLHKRTNHSHFEVI